MSFSMWTWCFWLGKCIFGSDAAQSLRRRVTDAPWRPQTLATPLLDNRDNSTYSIYTQIAVSCYEKLHNVAKNTAEDKKAPSLQEKQLLEIWWNVLCLHKIGFRDFQCNYGGRAGLQHGAYCCGTPSTIDPHDSHIRLSPIMTLLQVDNYLLAYLYLPT